jgi:hypothetical protein
LEYYATYKSEFGWDDNERPSGIAVQRIAFNPDWSLKEYHAIAWDHLQQAWVYDPDEIAAYLGDEDMVDRQRSLDRAEAERVTPLITGGEELPDEDTIQWIFQWKGKPPQAEDTPHRWAWDRGRGAEPDGG